MNSPSLVRVDYRLVHGQVVTYWIPALKIKHIVLVDDEVKNDQFVSMVFELSKPQGTTIAFFSCKQAAESWKNGTLVNNDDPYIILFKTVENAYTCYKEGMNFEKLQLGNMVSGPNKINVNSMYFIGIDEAKKLDEMAGNGVDIVLNATGNLKKESWSSIKERHFKNI